MPMQISYQCDNEGCTEKAKYIFKGAMIGFLADRDYATVNERETPIRGTMHFSVCEHCVGRISEQMIHLAKKFIEANDKLAETKAAAEAAKEGPTEDAQNEIGEMPSL